MSFPRYPEYKPSGVEWLGEVPAHWGVLPIKRDLDFITSGSRGWADHYADDGELFIRIGNLTRDSLELDLSDIQRVAVPSGSEGERTTVKPGDLLFSITAYLGSVAIAPNWLEPSYVSQHVALARLAGQKLTPRWVGYAVLSFIGKTYLEIQAYGGTKIQLGLDDVANLVTTVPPIPEQTAIAAFLDRETGKIDALVAEQQKLIALLKEKRQAVISHAVTKGLNPNAPMKPSGIEWLGDVPAHWEVRRIKHFACLFEQGWSPQCEGYAAEGNEWAVLKVGCVNGGRFTRSENKVLPPDLLPIPELGLRKGDLLVSRANTRELVGSAAAIAVDEPKLLLCDKLYRIRFVVGTLEASFVAHYLATPGARGQIELEATGASASMVNIGQATILEMSIAVPPYDEQADILKAIQAATARTDQLLAAAASAIALLKERRSALISAAVTGQIDVRGLIPV